MRVAFVSQSLDAVAPHHVNSVGLVTHHLAAGLASTDDVVVYASLACRGNQGTWSGAEGVTYRLLPSAPSDHLLARSWPYTSRVAGWVRHGLTPPMSTAAVANLGYARALSRELSAEPFDVVHVQHATQLLPTIRRAAPDALLVLHAHAEWFAQTPVRVLRRRLDGTDLIVACSDYVRGRLVDHVPGIADRCVTVHNGVDMTAFAPPPVPDQPDDDDGDPSVLYLGAVSPHKGVHDTIGAFVSIARRRPTLRLGIVGPAGGYPLEECWPLDDRALIERLRPLYHGDYRRLLERSIPKDLRPRVTFAGRLDRDVVLERLQRAAVVVFASIWDEGFGLPALEALAAGTPVIATRSGGVPEFVLDGTTGVLVDKGDQAGIAAAIERLLDDPAERARLGSAGRALAAERFAWPHIVEELRHAYLVAANRPGGSGVPVPR